MSKKRTATSELNHDNWDDEDPKESNEIGVFTPANNDILEKRVIRTAKRRAANASDGTTRGVFSGFGGFSKAQPSSFDFLANLTNGSKTTNGSPSSKNDTAVSSSVFSANSGSSGTGLFSAPVSSTSPTKATFAMPSSQSSSLFGGTLSASSTNTFTASKADSTVGNFTFKTQTPTSLPENTNKAESTSVVSSTMFGIPPNNTETKKSLFSTAATSSPFKIQPVPSSVTTATSSSSVTTPNDTKTASKKPEESDKKLKYYTKLKGLNESVSEWIQKHVEKTPLCILSPIFKDYEKHLKDIQEEYHGSKPEDTTKIHSEEKVTTTPKSESTLAKVTPFSGTGNTLFSSTNLLKANSASPFSTQSSPFNSSGEKTDKVASISNSTSMSTTGFSFGINTSPQNTSTSTPAPAPFSFGIGKPFSISNFNAPKPTEANTNAEEADDEPPKVEYTPVEEKDSVYDKKCKIFVKKDGNFVERGVGTLYIKKIEESGKHQLLVRANTNLGNVMLNLVLGSSVPTQRMGKNNVMMICIPTPDAKPPPVTVLIRVKTSEEADELLETLNKYKA